MVKAQLEAMPTQREMEMAMASGGKWTSPDGTAYDFAGKSDSELAKVKADTMAQLGLDVQKQYGSQYVDQAKALQEQANPEGVAMRKQLAGQINEQAGTPADTALSKQLLDQHSADVAKGGALSDTVQREVEQATLRNQAQVGNDLGNAAAFTNAMNTGSQAQAQRAQAQSSAQSFLQSGTTPQDIEFRQTQQTMGNEGAFLAGQTPQAQFGQISGAQAGAAPVMPGQSQVKVDPNAAQQGVTAGLQGYATGLQNTIVSPSVGAQIGSDISSY